MVVYCNLIRSAYKDVPIIAGGIEASLRRLAHYDYWSNKMKRSILLDAQADIIPMEWENIPLWNWQMHWTADWILRILLL